MKESKLLLDKLNISKNDTLVVAISGGPDSMALLHFLHTNNYKIICAHVNHNLRIESEEEYTFLEKYCKEKDIPFEGMKIASYKNNRFTENEARQKRYDFFEMILKKYNTKYLLTAHHGDDLIETILLRIIRGSNINGYKGFSKISKYKEYELIRPLIFYTKKEIETYIKENNIPCVYDKSNNSKKYSRNRIRLELLPILKQENKDIHKKFLELSEELEECSIFIEEYINSIKSKNYANQKLDIEKFKTLNQYVQKKEIESILLELYKDNISLINKNHIENILNLINSNKMGKIYLPRNIIVTKSYNKIMFNESTSEISNYNIVFDNEVTISNYGTINKIDDTIEKSNYVIKLNSQEIKLPLIIRNTAEKDFICVKNMNGRKYINRIFIDEKIEKEKRYEYPIVTDSNNNILWIPGIKKSKYDCYNKDNYDIILKYTKKGD